jgi:pSer/pThr/pTyr-binding forkhead associated (FHA) protein
MQENTKSFVNSVYLINRSTQESFQIHDEMTIGRIGNDVNFENTTSVSKKHCKLKVSGLNVFIEDLDSTNGTLVNNVKIKSKQLAFNDEIRIGNIVLIFSNQPIIKNHISNISKDEFTSVEVKNSERPKRFNELIHVLVAPLNLKKLDGPLAIYIILWLFVFIEENATFKMFSNHQLLFNENILLIKKILVTLIWGYLPAVFLVAMYREWIVLFIKNFIVKFILSGTLILFSIILSLIFMLITLNSIGILDQSSYNKTQYYCSIEKNIDRCLVRLGYKDSYKKFYFEIPEFKGLIKDAKLLLNEKIAKIKLEEHLKEDVKQEIDYRFEKIFKYIEERKVNLYYKELAKIKALYDRVKYSTSSQSLNSNDPNSNSLPSTPTKARSK